METSESREVRIVAFGAGALIVGAAAATLILACKLHQARAYDCGDFGDCSGNDGAVATLLTICVVDIFAAAVFLFYVALEEARRAAIVAYVFAVATAVTSVALVTLWFITDPPPPTLLTVIGAAFVFAATAIVSSYLPPEVMVALGAMPLSAFLLLTLLATQI